MGNTCYLNSCMQLFNRINELKEILAAKRGVQQDRPNARLANSVSDLLTKLDNSGEAFGPKTFLSVFFSAFPQFSEKDEHGHGFQQQDADECFQLLLAALEPAFEENGRNKLRELFELTLRVEFVNKETGEPEGAATFEKAKKLACIIDNQMNPINSLSEGIQLGLEDQVTKHSEALGRDAEFVKRFRVTNLPGYLVVQKIRFVWRGKDQATNTEARKAKILRNVSFPRILDLYDFCDPALQSQLAVNRKEDLAQQELRKKEAAEAYEKYKKEQGLVDEDNYNIYKKFQAEQRRRNDEKHDSDLWAPLGKGRPTGNYELVGVITHKGRSSDSGHYVSWVQQRGDAWLKFDDAEVSKATIEDVLNLRGGGDWHMAYYLLYRRLDFIE